jgi:hypothetical protein
MLNSTSNPKVRCISCAHSKFDPFRTGAGPQHGAASGPFRRHGHRSVAGGFDTALRAVLKASPGLALSEGPRNQAESKPEGRTIPPFHE